MNRRAALRDLFLLSAGITLLPACSTDSGKSSLALEQIPLTGDAEKSLEALSRALLPLPASGDEEALPLHQYALKMINDCAPADALKSFNEGLPLFMETCRKQFGGKFHELEAGKKEAVLRFLEEGKELPESLQSFYKTWKRRSIHAYTSSRDFLEKIRQYNIIPGNYQGCVPA